MKTQTLAAEFMMNYAEPRLRPSTIRGYMTNLNKHILPQIGETELNRITPDTLDEINRKWTQLSNKSKIYCHATLRKMLNYAIKRGYLDKNPYAQFDMPRAEKYNYTTLSEEDIKRMLIDVKGWRIEAPVTMALCYGLRRGECLGIKAQDIDIKNNILHIQRTRSWEYGRHTVTPCKTDKSNRYILINTEHAIMLTGYAEERARELTPQSLDKEFNKFISLYSYPDIRFHDLRHSYATLMLKKGINPKIVSTVLGHSKVDTTLDIYSHPDVTMQQACLDAMK